MIKPSEKHVIISSIFGIIIFVVLLTLGLTNVTIINPEQLASTLLTTAGIFIGFVISALGIYYSIPLREEIKIALIKQGYYKQVARNFILCIISFTIVIIISIISICIFSKSEYLIIQHILNTITISFFVFAIILLVFTCVNFFKIVIKNK